MCGRVNIAGRVYGPGTIFNVQDSKGTDRKTWGIGDLYNARLESCPTIWSSMCNNRGILLTNGFYEKDVYIQLENTVIVPLAVLYTESNNFLIITKPAQDSIGNIHHRMPLIIENIDDWIMKGLTYQDKIHSLKLM